MKLRALDVVSVEVGAVQSGKRQDETTSQNWNKQMIEIV